MPFPGYSAQFGHLFQFSSDNHSGAVLGSHFFKQNHTHDIGLLAELCAEKFFLHTAMISILDNSGLPLEHRTFQKRPK